MSEYTITIVETINNEATAIVDGKPLDDPFIVTTIRPARKLFWALLFGRLKYRVVVSGNKEVTAYVMNRAREASDADRSDIHRGINDERAIRPDNGPGTTSTTIA